MSVIYGAQTEIVAEVLDAGNHTKMIKPRNLHEWAKSMEASNNHHDSQLSHLSALVYDLRTKQAALEHRLELAMQFNSYVGTNYPAVVHEYVTAQEAKDRLSIFDECNDVADDTTTGR